MSLEDLDRKVIKHRSESRAERFGYTQYTSDGGSTPGYYALPEGCREIQDLIEFKSMNFALGNIFKACYRLGQKQGTDATYDLKKIIYYAERELRRIDSPS